MTGMDMLRQNFKEYKFIRFGCILYKIGILINLILIKIIFQDSSNRIDIKECHVGHV